MTGRTDRPRRPSRSEPRRHFAFAFSPSYRVAARLFAITPQNAEVTLDSRTLRVRFGPWRFATELANIWEIAVTGPYWYVKTAGPARLAITDRGLTFATNGRQGVRLRFRVPVRGIEPTGLLRHPELTLTVADVDGFTSALEELTGLDVLAD